MTSPNQLTPELEQIANAIQRAISEHQTQADYNGVTDIELDQAYSEALSYYQQQDMNAALVAFTYLIMNNPWRRHYIVGFASSLHALEQYENALTFYGYAALMDACDAGITFRIAQCFFAINRQTEAIEALKTSIDQSFIEPVQPEIRALAQNLLQEIIS
ncbi:CesD/SycD/LcrH family type III secretion system chaperone [Shewanella surugensis]|uniref:CesD/SycD/LcrH family type III secretion system chaperone n=1 Tax=Shewanella surugensis TaxID=212020 RepID=A0ABT0L6B3_9GAMM|nr:CesD/SycD/LcrH family type III secretion system chaperone [Shewanella surugensis]MCL1123229.1 CesD/SycD/LcrH family type III secretion system chaperone [Shewanella surugensis]